MALLSRHRPSRILVAGSQAVIRAGVRLALDEQPGLHVVAEACDLGSALAAIQAAKPDVAVVELDLPGPGPLEMVRQFLAQPSLELVLLLNDEDDNLLTAVLSEGVRAVLSKNAPMANLIDAVRAVRQDPDWIPPQLRARLDAAPDEPAREVEEAWSSLTARERQVAGLVAQGLPYREVAARLAISDHTVKNHLRRIYDKLDINSRVELAVQGAAVLHESH